MSSNLIILWVLVVVVILLLIVMGVKIGQLAERLDVEKTKRSILSNKVESHSEETSEQISELTSRIDKFERDFWPSAGNDKDIQDLKDGFSSLTEEVERTTNVASLASSQVTAVEVDVKKLREEFDEVVKLNELVTEEVELTLQERLANYFAEADGFQEGLDELEGQQRTDYLAIAEIAVAFFESEEESKSA